MKIALCYVFPNVLPAVYEPLARRFVQSYMAVPPGLVDHEIVILSNGYPLDARQRALFHPLPFTEHTHSNSGKDIGAYQSFAEKSDADLMLCFGSHVHFWRPGWLDRMAQVFLRNGPGLYGAWGFHEPADHIRTTAFWLPAGLLRDYPHNIGDDTRYEFEHGRTGITAWCQKVGYPVIQVTWTRALERDKWAHIPKVECLLLDQHSERAGIG